MSKSDRLAYLMNEQTLVTVTNPAFPNAPWVGTIIGLTENPSMVLQQAGSFRVTLPQAFAVEPASNAPSSPVETTGGVSGTTSYAGVVRPADEAEAPRQARYAKALRAEHQRIGADQGMTLADFAALARAVIPLADAEHDQLWEVIRANGDRNARLMRERDEALARLSDSEARVERLWAQLNEATNVPEVPSDPDYPAGECPRPRCVHYRRVAASIAAKAKQADGPDKVWCCDTSGRVNGVDVSSAVQAADDRRSL